MKPFLIANFVGPDGLTTVASPDSPQPVPDNVPEYIVNDLITGGAVIMREVPDAVG
jgi:hypothetical protein